MVDDYRMLRDDRAFVRERLASSVKVDDCKAAMDESDRTGSEHSLAIRPAVRDRIPHLGQQRSTDRPSGIRVKNTCNTAH